MDIQKLKSPIDDLVRAMKLACEKAGADFDPDMPTRAEIVFFVFYLINDGGFNDDELGAIEEAAGYRINRDHWSEIMELGRVDSEEHYLSQPPNSVIVMVDMDNALYEIGEEPACVNGIMEVYKFIGETFVKIKGSTDENRKAKYKRFLEMIDRYQKENSKGPDMKPDPDGGVQGRVIPFKKGVSAPKKS